MADFSESFEGAGYENAGWSETAGTGCTVDEDAAIPGSAPPNAGSQCLRCNSASTGFDARINRSISSKTTVYLRFYMYIASEGLGDGDFARLFFGWENGYANDAFQLYVTQVAGALKLQFVYYDGGGQYPAQADLATTTWHCVEVEFDIAGDSWELRVDDATICSGAFAGGSPDAANVDPIQLGAFNGSAIDVYHDLFALSWSDWVGPEVAAGVAGGMMRGQT
jgi:hypothetical protein